MHRCRSIAIVSGVDIGGANAQHCRTSSVFGGVRFVMSTRRGGDDDFVRHTVRKASGGETTIPFCHDECAERCSTLRQFRMPLTEPPKHSVYAYLIVFCALTDAYHARLIRT